MTVTIHVGDCRDVLRTLPDESVQCVVTSPPYWGLRDYSTEPQVWDGDADCCHVWENATYVRNNDQTAGEKQRTNVGSIGRDDPVINAFCQLCGAWRGSLGLEPTPELYTQHLVEIFRDVRRVLRDDGVCWLNLGDSYATSQAGNKTWGDGVGSNRNYESGDIGLPKRHIPSGLKPKDLVGIPWRVAFALQADGWWLRSDIIWAKPNCMPESVTDRPTKSHEYVFLLTKSARYFYDADAIREPHKWEHVGNYRLGSDSKNQGSISNPVQGKGNTTGSFRAFTDGGRNKRTVWTITTSPFPGAHFATFPPALVEPMIKAGTSERGCCAACGSPWKRIIEKPDMSQRPIRASDAKCETDALHISNNWAGTPKSAGQAYQKWRDANPDITIGWRPTCECEWQSVPVEPWMGIDEMREPMEPVPCTVLDPFAGAGTVGLVADRLQRDAILIELSAEYAEMARKRIKKDSPMFTTVEVHSD